MFKLSRGMLTHLVAPPVVATPLTMTKTLLLDSKWRINPTLWLVILLLPFGAGVVRAGEAAPEAAARMQTAHASPVGLWRVMDGKQPQPISLIAISEKDGVFTGTVMRVMRSTQGSHPVCTACKGELHNKPVVGMTVVWGLHAEEGKPVYSGGSVLDPAKGQTYRCRMTLLGPDTLEMRGYLGISLLGRTQIWQRAQPQELTLGLPAKP